MPSCPSFERVPSGNTSSPRPARHCATAVFTADKLGDQVAGVVAMESFANAGVAIRTMIPHLMGLQPEGLKAQAVASYARWRYGG